MLGAPERARAGAAGLCLFVNRRPVRDRALARAVSFAYGSVLPPGRYPVGVVYVDLDPREVDVNVHPQKAEVRFERGREVLDAITRVLAAGLGTTAWSGFSRRGPESRGAGFWQERLEPVAAPASAPDPWGLAPAPAEPRAADAPLEGPGEPRADGATEARPFDPPRPYPAAAPPPV